MYNRCPEQLKVNSEHVSKGPIYNKILGRTLAKLRNLPKSVLSLS